MTAERSGKRRSREQSSKRRRPDMGYYLIVTDTEETEYNYLTGLRDSIPEELRGKLVIKVFKAKTANLVSKALEIAALEPQYREPWIIFDRDKVQNFDKIISSAEEKGVNVGWSNPCIEIWFSAYLGAMPACENSTACCQKFERQYLKVTKQSYKKSDPEIYDKLCLFGDEKAAVSIAENKIMEHERNDKTKPSEMLPATTVHRLIDEIRQKIK